MQVHKSILSSSLDYCIVHCEIATSSTTTRLDVRSFRKQVPHTARSPIPPTSNTGGEMTLVSVSNALLLAATAAHVLIADLPRAGEYNRRDFFPFFFMAKISADARMSGCCLPSTNVKYPSRPVEANQGVAPEDQEEGGKNESEQRQRFTGTRHTRASRLSTTCKFFVH